VGEREPSPVGWEIEAGDCDMHRNRPATGDLEDTALDTARGHLSAFEFGAPALHVIKTNFELGAHPCLMSMEANVSADKAMFGPS
jgi:hypothetical protein